MSEEILVITSGFITAYAIISVICFCMGIISVNAQYSGCNEPLTRIDYVFPAYQFGCYMNSPIKSENK